MKVSVQLTISSKLIYKKRQDIQDPDDTSALTVVSTELDALGDEFMLDDDSSYLDEAATAPSIPEGLPGDKSINRVFHILKLFLCHW